MNSSVQIMNKNKNQENEFQLLRQINRQPKVSQRQLAKNLGMSLGKLNYCIKALKEKGFLKISNFRNNPNKMNYLYVLTPKGISEKSKMTINFMQMKMQEYDELKSELKND
jgi:EPS-associated MarR family transcriptional regulator